MKVLRLAWLCSVVLAVVNDPKQHDDIQSVSPLNGCYEGLRQCVFISSYYQVGAAMEIFRKGTEAKLKNDVFWLVAGLVSSLTVVFARRHPSAHLAHKCLDVHWLASDKYPVIMLHSIANIKETWDGIYQNISFFTGRGVCIYDARNHGDSSWNKTFGVDTLAEDLRDFMESRNIEKVSLVGHSMGGLTVMKFALNYPNKVESIFIEDSSPRGVRPDVTVSTMSLWITMLNSLSAIPPYADAKTAKKAVINYFIKVTNEPPPAFLFKRFPLRCRYGLWQWKANLPVLLKSFEDVDSWVGRMEGLYKGRAFFIYGTASPFRVFEDKSLIRKLFPRAEFFGVEGAGHRIHPKYPVFFSKLVEFLNLQNSQKYAEKRHL